ncbi:MAG: sodium:proton exchanger [Actinomycetota bacterium]
MRPTSTQRAVAGRVVPLAVAVGLATPAVALRSLGVEPAPLTGVLLYGAAFIGAALLLAWGTELAQLDLPPGLAIAILAFIAIMPEYAIDLLFAYQAGDDPSKAPLALANMTGANRLLIGVGWSLVVLVGYAGFRRARRREGGPAQPERSSEQDPRKRRVPDGPGFQFLLSRLSAVDVVLLGLVSAYTLGFLLRTTLSVLDTVILFSAFGLYVYRLWRAPREEREFIGPPALISGFPTGVRRLVTVTLMAAAAMVILSVAEPFSGALVAAGEQVGVDPFLMVQWVAPFAAETAELIPACLFAWRQSADEGLGTLLSSKINQWTLLVGAVPVAYAAATLQASGLPVDAVQRQELFLTAAQSLFAVSLLTDLRLGVREALTILALFLTDFAGSVALSEPLRSWLRVGFGLLYLALGLLRLAAARGRLAGLVQDGLRTPPALLAQQERTRA